MRAGVYAVCVCVLACVCMCVCLHVRVRVCVCACVQISGGGESRSALVERTEAALVSFLWYIGLFLVLHRSLFCVTSVSFSEKHQM